MSENTATAIPATSVSNGRRRQLLTGLVILVVIAAIASIAYYLVHGRWFESTEDAYANGNIVQVTPLVPGTVVEISATDNMLVKAGQPLIKLDPSDSRVALDQTEASLARTVRQVRGLYSNVEGQSADLSARQLTLDRARADVERRRGLDASGAIPKEEMAHMQAALESAERAVTASREQLSGTQALTDNTSVATHPEVKAALPAAVPAEQFGIDVDHKEDTAKNLGEWTALMNETLTQPAVIASLEQQGILENLKNNPHEFFFKLLRIVF